MRLVTALIITGLTAPALADNRALELTYLTPVITENLAEYGEFQVPAFENIAIIEDGENAFLELRMLPGQKIVNRGNRAEISIDMPHVEGDTMVYEWRMRIPATSEVDPENRWWLVGQWHDQPDLRIGETWDDFPDRSPPVGIGYGHIDGHDVISMSYGAPEQHNITHTPFSRDIWHDMRVVIHWSTGNDGWAQMYMDNLEVPFAQADGRNMYNSFQHFMKLGMYRDRGIQVSSQIQLDDIRIYIAAD